MDLTLSTIAAMRHQEKTGYVAEDWLHHDEHAMSMCAGPLHASVDADCRNKMTSWMYQVVDFTRMHRESVAIAMNYLDRFLNTPEGHNAKMDRTVYQLAAMTTLYTAVKIHEPEAMDPKLVSNLSRGAYTPQQIEAMESLILDAIQWRLNPPTALAFVRQFLDLIPEQLLSQQLRQTAYDITKYQTELAVNEFEFITINASTVAYCAFMNALESVGVSSRALCHIGGVLSQAIGLNCYDNQVIDVQNWLYESVMRQPAGGITMAHPTPVKPVKASRRSSIEESPRSVSAMQ
jgi:Cyclin, N-terminal domain